MLTLLSIRRYGTQSRDFRSGQNDYFGKAEVISSHSPLARLINMASTATTLSEYSPAAKFRFGDNKLALNVLGKISATNVSSEQTRIVDNQLINGNQEIIFSYVLFLLKVFGHLGEKLTLNRSILIV